MGHRCPSDSISLIILIGCTSADELPPLGSYYDFMNRFWTAPRCPYSRTAFFPAGHKMSPWGNDPIKDSHKYRCPLKCGRIDSCPNAGTCSPGSYGRTVYIKNNSDLRFHPRIPRGFEEYRKTYSERTACERVNDRILNDYRLQHLKIRGRDHFSFWTMLIGICIHLDARYKVAHLYTA